MANQNENDLTEVKLPINPQEIAIKMYTDLVADAVKQGKTSPEQMRDIVLITVECACRAQKAGIGMLLEVLGDRSPDLEYRRCCGELADIVNGKKKPMILSEDAAPRILVTDR